MEGGFFSGMFLDGSNVLKRFYALDNFNFSLYKLVIRLIKLYNSFSGFGISTISDMVL